MDSEIDPVASPNWPALLPKTDARNSGWLRHDTVAAERANLRGARRAGVKLVESWDAVRLGAKTRIAFMIR